MRGFDPDLSKRIATVLRLLLVAISEDIVIVVDEVALLTIVTAKLAR